MTEERDRTSNNALLSDAVNRALRVTLNVRREKDGQDPRPLRSGGSRLAKPLHAGARLTPPPSPARDAACGGRDSEMRGGVGLAGVVASLT